MDKQKVQRIVADMEEALTSVAEAHQISIMYKGGSYTSNNAIIKFEVAEVTSTGTAKTREREAFEQYAPYYGLEGKLDAQFKHAGETFRIAGLKPSSKKYPILAERTKDGKVFKFSYSSLQQILLNE